MPPPQTYRLTRHIGFWRNFNSAFTLAEVLITLGIIGVVAAITIPTVINNIQNKQNIVKWKKEYSVISNAFQAILNENIQITDSGMFSDEFMNAMKEKVSVADMCGKNSKMPDKMCDMDINYSTGKFRPNRKFPWAGISGQDVRSYYKPLGSSSMINNYNFGTYVYLLNDGAAVYFGSLWNGPWIVVDVNNFTKGPNEIGRDVFVIKVYSNNETNQHWIKPAGAEGTPNWNTSSSGSSGCSKDIGQKQSNTVYDAAGAGCSAKYLLN